MKSAYNGSPEGGAGRDTLSLDFRGHGESSWVEGPGAYALTEFAAELRGDDAGTLEPWDVGYYSEKLRQARYAFDDEALRPYFGAEQVLSGLFEIVQKLYGVTIEERSMPVWN